MSNLNMKTHNDIINLYNEYEDYWALYSKEIVSNDNLYSLCDKNETVFIEPLPLENFYWYFKGYLEGYNEGYGFAYG